MMKSNLLIGLALFACTGASAGECTFAQWTTFGGATLLRNEAAPAYVFAVSGVRVDADGAPNAYHPDDAGLSCTRGAGFKGLDCPANAGYPGSDWWQGVLVPDPADPAHAYVQPQDAEFAGYFVSQTTLTDKTKPATDPAKYVDSRKVPYLVYPGSFLKMTGTGYLGDFGYTVNVTNGKSSPFLVADVGPTDAPLGEISIALATALGGTDPNPRTGAGAPTGTILYVVFPYSHATPAWPVTNEQIATRVGELLDKIGGTAALTDCRDAL